MYRVKFKAFFMPVLAFSCVFTSAFAGFSTFAAAEESERYSFVILRPDDSHPFWQLFQDVMEDACEDLGCDVTVFNANWDHYAMVDQAKALRAQEKKPDMVFFQSFKNNGDQVIKALEEQGINGFLVNAGLTEAQAKEIGAPREKYTHWVGQMMPDDYGAGKMVAKALYEKVVKDKDAAAKVEFLAIEGNAADGASIQRLKGLKDFIAENGNIELLQVVEGKWDAEVSKAKAVNLMGRFPDVKVYWAAGDPVAFGVIDAAQEVGRTSDVFTAGVDWAPRALEEIKEGRMVGSAGGHFMEGAWAAIVAYDYLKGVDFKEEHGLALKSNMGFLNSDNISAYNEKFGDGDFGSVDFKNYSKFYSPDSADYNFDILKLLAE